MSGTGADDENELVVYQTILDTLNGPRVVWRDGEPAVDMSAYERPFAPAVEGTSAVLVPRRTPPA